MKRIEEPIDVGVTDERPAAFRWREANYRVSEVLDTWNTEEGAWWKFSRRESRRYYRVHAAQDRRRLTAEIYAAIRGDKVKWILSAVYD